MKTNEKHLLVNQWATPRGTILRSRNRHDYVTVEEDGKTYFVDGGLDYIRRSGGLTCKCVRSDDPFEVIRESVEWGTYGKHGDQPLSYIKLKDMTNRHLETLLDASSVLPFHSLNPGYEVVMERELKLRADGVYPNIND